MAKEIDGPSLRNDKVTGKVASNDPIENAKRDHITPESPESIPKNVLRFSSV